MNTPYRPTEADFGSTVPFWRSGMRLFIQRFGLQRFVLSTSHVIPKSDVVLELVLEIGVLRGARWRSLAVRDGTSQLDCASDFDVTSLALNIFAHFGAGPRTSRTARRMAHGNLCAALLLLGCVQ